MYDIKINKRIKQIRKEHNVSQQEFGEKLGVSRDVISNIENNRVEVKTVFITHMCEIFNVNKEWILTGEGEIYISTEDIYSTLEEVFYKIASSKDENLKELVINLSKLDATYIASLNEIVKRTI
ncbi:MULTISPECIES: helix-turn-helix transcriptional regulator [unclassified Clostridioides]|uniref:helix-turn-helix domain-containing protein n=1 Tax=unclassified Clostridioides TaxID=2635829 RepID=UPI001D1075D1|nr:helix-turn-helix transcriptional regulator [Clostridioides sp. ES-S-0049-03]MCC0678207.1 helix-turn-helix transcriptional regulator [Clostridioides sp. ES-W-0018-02]MCC0713051.1 helix-turn-helix transcriptional regulator [Clostridioides sp. ES-W-0017-02]